MSTKGQNTDASNSPLLRIGETARYLGVSESWLKQHPTAIPFIRIGVKNKRWRIEDLNDFISKSRRGGK